MSDAQPPDPIPELAVEPYTPRVLDERPVRFHELVRDLWRGSVDDAATTELASVVEAVAALGKPGKFTIEITVDPSGHGATVILSAKTKAKVPEAPPEAGTLFVGNAGALHRNDPFRPSMVDRDAKVIDDARPDTPPKRLSTDPRQTPTPKGDMTTEATAIADLARQAATATMELVDESLDTALFVIDAPRGHEVALVDVEAMLDQPRRARGTVTVYDADGFVQAVRQRAGDGDLAVAGMAVYADEDRKTLVAILNDDTSTDGAGWRDERVELGLRERPEWKLWKGLDHANAHALAARAMEILADRYGWPLPIGVTEHVDAAVTTEVNLHDAQDITRAVLAHAQGDATFALPAPGTGLDAPGRLTWHRRPQ